MNIQWHIFSSSEEYSGYITVRPKNSNPVIAVDECWDDFRMKNTSNKFWNTHRKERCGKRKGEKNDKS